MKNYKEDLKSVIKRNSKLYYSITYILIFLKICWKVIMRLFAYFVNKITRHTQKPKVLQLFITYKCNFDCVMCGMKKAFNKSDFSTDDLSRILKDELFTSIRSVEINGGEPFLIGNLSTYVIIMLGKLSNLKNINIITNGYFTEKILHQLEVIKPLCKEKNIRLNVSISIDGVDSMQDVMRGKTNSFSNAVSTFNNIKARTDEFCDNLNLICTITKFNIEYINEIEFWAKENSAKVIYNIAAIHKRIYNEDRCDKFSIFTDEKSRCLTSEFFYSKFLETKSERYYALYKYVIDNVRISPCQYQYEGVTVTPDGQLSYCAEFSNVISDGISNDANKIYKNNLKYLKEICGKHCGICSHNIEQLSIRGYISMYREILRSSMLPIQYYW